MCCFSGPVAHVADTNLFARASTGNRQILVYQMQLQSAAPTAMILPLPVPPRSREDAIRFIDLSSYPHFFTDLRRPFVGPENRTRSGGGAALAALPEPRLAVHRVGSFEASFVPSLEEFARLDERFRLPPAAWDALPRYHDWGFAVFKLHNVDQVTAVEPMAFEFPRRDAGALFFPTVHIHDGVAHARAEYDHNLFLQSAVEDELVAVGNHARRAGTSPAPVKDLFATPLHARGILDENLPIQVARFAGVLANHDGLMPGKLNDLQMLEFQAWQKNPRPIRREAAVALVAWLAAARSSDEVTPQSMAAGIAAVDCLPWANQTVNYFGNAQIYGAPEYCTGQGKIDERSDVYAMAALLYRLINGRTLFGEGMQAIVGHLREPPPPLGSPSQALNDLAARALAKDPAERFQTLRELAQALSSIG